MSRPVRRPLLAAVVLPLVVIVGFQSAWAAYACSIDGKVRDHCCCKAKKRDARQPADGAPRIVRPDCCQVSLAEHRDQPAVRETPSTSFAHFDVVVPVVSSALLAVRVEGLATPSLSARAPPRVPLFLNKQAILR